jgi:transposase
MTLHRQAIYLIPAETERVAREAFPTPSPMMALRDELGMVFTDSDFADLFPPVGQPAESPSRLLLVTIFQFMEGLTDRQGADAVRRCIDWKYALALELTDPGFHYSVLSEFRDRLLEHDVALRYFDRLLDHCRARGWLKARGRQRTDATHVLAAIRTLSRLEAVGEMVRHTLDVLAQVAPEWLYDWLPAAWFDRYGTRFADFRLPKGSAARQELAETIGTDGYRLLTEVQSAPAPPWLRELPVIQTLRLMWWQQFTPTEQGAQWRDSTNVPPNAQMLHSPYDLDARYSLKRTTGWVGYKVHITETCDPDTPNLITNIETTTATQHDSLVIDTIHDKLAARELLPAEHLVDGGYVSSETLLSSQQEEVDLYGPIQNDHSWQAKAGEGYDLACFVIDWEAKQVVCPQGQRTTIWTPAKSADGRDMIHAAFHKKTCAACEVRANCTRAKTAGRELSFHLRPQYEAVVAARERQASKPFRRHYAMRAGVEGTIAQGTRTCDLRQARFRGLPKVRLQHLFTAMAINCKRMIAAFAETTPSQARPSLFVRLAPALA